MTASDWTEDLCSLQGVQGQEGAAVVSRWDQAVFLDSSAPVAIFTSVVNMLCISLRYRDLSE